MKDKRQIIPVGGLLSIVVAAVLMVVRLSGQTAAPTGDFTNAALAEVRSADGQVVLSGNFQQVDEEDDDVERKAVLTPSAVDPDAAGEAEIEFPKARPAEQEIGFSVRNLPPNAAFTFVIDGVEIGKATSNARGRAELEIDVRPAGVASR
jgi:hypothetical protein